ncbi:MAG: putative GNAT family acetyltransferase [Planctomycetota bacterium]|jgi:predicted GNAT family acetyltransferase
MEFIEHQSAGQFLEVAMAFLEMNESQNSLPMGLALRVRDESREADAGTRFFSVGDSTGVVAVAIQTPMRSVVFSVMAADAAQLAAVELIDYLETLVGCVGPTEVVDVVAEVWRRQATGTLTLHAGMGLYELTELTSPRPAEGRLRVVSDGDFELCQRWVYQFMIDCNLPEATPGKLPGTVPQVEQRSLYFWEVDGEPVACAGWSRPLREGITVSLVYTPDEFRGRGYASNVVAELTAGLLDGSLYQPARKRVTLYTDLANPTSNSIYQKLGYKRIGDHKHFVFEEE